MAAIERLKGELRKSGEDDDGLMDSFCGDSWGPTATAPRTVKEEPEASQRDGEAATSASGHASGQTNWHSICL